MTDIEKETVYRILIIDDNQAIHQDFAKILVNTIDEDSALNDLEATIFGSSVKPKGDSLHFTLDYATQGAEGLAMVEQALAEDRPYALAFVDGRMPPGMDGIETIQCLWQAYPELQIVLCTAYSDYSWQEIIDILGSSDNLLILKKPFDNVEVLQMAHALTCKWELAMEIKGRLHQLAFYDYLTGLPNRLLLSDRIAMSLERARQKRSLLALLFIDIDNFKLINDSLGHSSGDKLLKVVAKRIAACLRTTDIISRETAARVGGDEFVVVLPEISSEHDATQVARRISHKVAKTLTIDEYPVLTTLSIGIALYPQDGDTAEDLLKNADLAMYTAKKNGKNSFAFYRESMNDRAVRRMKLERELRQALGGNEFSLHYQPQLNLYSGTVSGLEALLRWHNPVLGQVPPLEFIDVAEELGLIVDIGAWVLRVACAQTKAWRDQGVNVPRISVNVSAIQFSHPDFAVIVKNILAETGIDPQLLELEITETLLVENVSNLQRIIDQLKEMQIRIAIDDFGTGYAGLNRFRNINVDRLKIDQSFVSGIERGISDQNLIRGIVSLARCLNLNVIAEGVETPTQMEFLRSIGCQEIQGYLYSKPLNIEAAEAFLRNPPDMSTLPKTMQAGLEAIAGQGCSP